MERFTPLEDIPPLLVRIEAIARGAGVRVYAVGGSVRDALLGRTVRDLDVAVERDAIGFARQIAEALGGHFVELDDENGVARIALDEGLVRTVDVAQLRGSLADDLGRRDFTLDALAAPLTGGAVVDMCGGVEDLRARVVRMTGEDVLDADPLRLLRAVRIAAELRFTIEQMTQAAIARRAERVKEASPERRRDELARIFSLDDAHGALRTLDFLDLLDALLPELAAGRGVAQPENHHAYDVFEHSLRSVEAMDALLAETSHPSLASWLRDDVREAFGWCWAQLGEYFARELSGGRSRGLLLKIAALLHDVAKPQTRFVDKTGRIRFFGHADEGAQVAAQIMRRLRFSGQEERFVSVLVAEHMRPLQLAQAGEAPTRRALYRMHRDTGDAVPALLFLALADAAASQGPRLTREGWRRQVRYMNSLLVRSYEEPDIVRPPRLLTGHDIMSELGVPPGPLVGRLLEALTEAQAAGEVGDREAALAFVRRRLRAPGRGRGVNPPKGGRRTMTGRRRA